MPKLTKSKKKAVKKSNFSAVKKIKTPSLYSQLRKRIYSEEKFLLLREKDATVKWDQVSGRKVSFVQSQKINKRTNLVLQELRQIREDRIKDYREKTSWSLRKQRAKIRRVRGKIDEVAYQNKLQELLNFTEKKSNYKGKLAREQYWSKKFQASPISLAQAELTKPRMQPDYVPARDLEALKFRVFRSKSIPAEVWDQPWLSHKERKTATLSTIYLPSPTLRKIETTREPLIDDKLKEYQYKVNFYQLFGRPPRTEKEIRKFASIDWNKERDNYWALYGLQTKSQPGSKGHELIIHPLDDKLWAHTQKNILAVGSKRYYWILRGQKESAHLPLFSKRSEHYKYFDLNKNYWTTDQQYLEREDTKLTTIKKKLTNQWAKEITRIKEKYAGWNLKSYGAGLGTNLVLSLCSPRCNCATNAACDPTGSEPACYTGYLFSADNHWLPNQHPPLAPSHCPYFNTSHFGREEYGKPNRWAQCGNTHPLVGDSWHHDFDAWHKGARGWGCHLTFPQTVNKKQKSRSTIVEMEW
jgi:hypothetical protein